MKLSRISLALLPLLTAFSTVAAVYQVVELEPNSVSKTTFAAALNDQGDAVVIGQGLVSGRGVDFINFPLDVATIDFENASITATLTPAQIEDAKQGIYDAQVLNFFTLFLARNIELTNQKIGLSVNILQAENALPAVLPLRDINQLRSNDEFIYDLNELGVAVGIATPSYSKQAFTPAADPNDEDAAPPETLTIWQPEAGFQYGVAVDNNGPITLLPPYTEFGGGFSRAFSVNNQNLIAGSGSVGLADSVITTLTTICNGNSEPTVSCLNTEQQKRVYTFAGLEFLIKRDQTVRFFQNGYQERAMLWQLQTDGGVSLSQTFGFLGEKGNGGAYVPVNNFSEVFYYSTANAVNDNGIAVGHSMYSDGERIIRSRDEFTGQEFSRIYAAPHATLYRNGEVSGIVDPAQWLASNAVDINNNNIVTGHAIKTVNGFRRDKFFYYDVAADAIVFPKDFFAGSSSVPKAINDMGQIVGNAEVIIGGTITRRLHGFIYDIASDTFRDLNSLLGCNATLTVVDASAINNNGEILATVLQSLPLLDAKGEPLLDESGNAVMVDQTKAVKLLPIANGQAEDCNTEQNSYQRKAGGFGHIGLMLLASFAWLLRRRRQSAE
ncbi:hypothetical protein VT06_00620 [Arsukibacterium sp. MJ3]|uniref:DUF3466 family protein n=1 Tax=Arsukibacterium sp. MJ3 TaxID=1632859 RepID=UPI000627097E|nr:DUF3466 family protein [Arsukibacterium sp. MJ3]KKO50528.1 hypothetical protein VT06_00620 [Arsukibacterium sp. MJ3]